MKILNKIKNFILLNLIIYLPDQYKKYLIKKNFKNVSLINTLINSKNINKFSKILKKDQNILFDLLQKNLRSSNFTIFHSLVTKGAILKNLSIDLQGGLLFLDARINGITNTLDYYPDFRKLSELNLYLKLLSQIKEYNLLEDIVLNSIHKKNIDIVKIKGCQSKYIDYRCPTLEDIKLLVNSNLYYMAITCLNNIEKRDIDNNLLNSIYFKTNFYNKINLDSISDDKIKLKIKNLQNFYSYSDGEFNFDLKEKIVDLRKFADQFEELNKCLKSLNGKIDNIYIFIVDKYIPLTLPNINLCYQVLDSRFINIDEIEKLN